MYTFAISIKKTWSNAIRFFKPSINILTLGRWNLTECPQMIDRKVDWANEDHCGPCGSNPIKLHSNSSKSASD